MLERGVPGTDQLGTTRRLAESVPDLAVRYLHKLATVARGAPAAPPAAARGAPGRGPGRGAGRRAPGADDPRLPAWKRYRG